MHPIGQQEIGDQGFQLRPVATFANQPELGREPLIAQQSHGPDQGGLIFVQLQARHHAQARGMVLGRLALHCCEAGKVAGVVDRARFTGHKAKVTHRGAADVLRTTEQTVGERPAKLHQSLEFGEGLAGPDRWQVAHVSANAAYPRQPCADRDQGMPAEWKAEHGIRSYATAKAVSQPGQASIARQSAAEGEGVDRDAESLELQPEIAGFRLQAQQLNCQALQLPVSGQLQGELGAAFGNKRGENDQNPA